MFGIPIHFFSGTKEHPLRISNQRTHIPLLINLLISLFELGIH